MKLLPITLALGLLTTSVAADTFTGRILDSTGAPVAGLNIDAKDENTGDDGNIMNDGTDANGFFAVTIDPGTYRLTFLPPPPPAALGLVHCIDNQVIAGVTDLGTITLQAARALSAHVVDPSSAPVAGVNLDVIDLVTGDNIDLVGGTTNLSGDFSIAVPLGPIELRMDTGPVVGPQLAPDHLFLDAGDGAALGVHALKPGFTITAALLDAGFNGIENLDVDVIDTVSGETLYTPGDNTDSNGFVDFVVPAGTFDMEFCPPNSSDFAAHLEKDVSVSANMSLGIITLSTGVRLSGTVTNYLAQTVSNVDIDVRIAGTQLSVLVCADSSNASGAYSIVLPSGSFDVSFSPSYALGLGSAVLTNVPVNSATTRNPVLPFCSMGTPTGSARAGSGGQIPQISSFGGSLRLGNPGWGFSVSNGLGGANAIAIMSLGNNCQVQRPGGLSGGLGPAQQTRSFLWTALQLSGPSGLAGAGSAQLAFPLPTNTALAGLFLSAQVQILDPAARGGRSATRTLCGQLCE